ncbi:MAG: ketopantoate reductase family protein, partial [Rhodospirillales bacterium]
MKIAVFGSGGIGGYFGARLAAAGGDVHFIARGAHLEAMRAGGLRVRSLNGDLHMETVHATDDPAAIGPVDVVLVAVKLYDTDAAARDCAPLVGPGTMVVSFQNGVAAADAFAAAVGRAHVIGGLAYIFSTIEAPGVIAHKGTLAKLVFGELDGGRTPRVEALLAACREAAIEAAISEDITADIWSKFAFLAALSGMTALVRLSIGPIRAEAGTRAMLRRAMEEVVAVARAKGIDLAADLVERHMETVDGLPGDF